MHPTQFFKGGGRVITLQSIDSAFPSHINKGIGLSHWYAVCYIGMQVLSDHKCVMLLLCMKDSEKYRELHRMLYRKM